jgi:hypothetical protein
LHAALLAREAKSVAIVLPDNRLVARDLGAHGRKV